MVVSKPLGSSQPKNPEFKAVLTVSALQVTSLLLAQRWRQTDRGAGSKRWPRRRPLGRAVSGKPSARRDLSGFSNPRSLGQSFPAVGVKLVRQNSLLGRNLWRSENFGKVVISFKQSACHLLVSTENKFLQLSRVENRYCLLYTIDSDVDNRVQLSLLPFKATTIPEQTANIETFTKYPHVNQYIGYIQCLTNPLRNVLVWNIFLLVQKYELKPKLGDWV